MPSRCSRCARPPFRSNATSSPPAGSERDPEDTGFRACVIPNWAYRIRSSYLGTADARPIPPSAGGLGKLALRRCAGQEDQENGQFTAQNVRSTAQRSARRMMSLLSRQSGLLRLGTVLSDEGLHCWRKRPLYVEVTIGLQERWPPCLQKAGAPVLRC